MEISSKLLHSQTIRASHVSHVMCHVSHVTCHVSRATCHLSHVMCCMSHVTCHMSHVTFRMSHVTCHVSHVICHIFSEKGWNLSVEGLLSTGPTPSSFRCASFSRSDDCHWLTHRPNGNLLSCTTSGLTIDVEIGILNRMKLDGVGPVDNRPSPD